MNEESAIGISGRLRARAIVPLDEVHLAEVRGAEKLRYSVDGEHAVIEFERVNAFVNVGLETMLDRAYGINGPPSAISHIALTADTTAVTAASTALDAGATGDISIKPFSPAAARTAQTVEAGATFTEADVTWVINKIGLLRGATDAGNLIDAIGGGGSSPYDESFSVDFTSLSSFSLTFRIDVTAVANS